LESYDSNLDSHTEPHKRSKRLLRHIEDKCLEVKVRWQELAELKEGMYDDDEDITPLFQDIMDGKIAIYEILESTWRTLESKASFLKTLTKQPKIAPGQSTPEPTVPDSEDDQNDSGIDLSAGMTTLAETPLNMDEERRMSGFFIPQKRPRSESPSDQSPPDPNKRVCVKIEKVVRFDELVTMREIPARGDEEEHVDAEMRSVNAEEGVPIAERAAEFEVMPEVKY